MKKKITTLIMTALLLVTLGGATALAAGNGLQGNQGQTDGSQRYAGTVTGTCTGVLGSTLDHCIYSHYNGYDSDSECRDSSTCICGGAHVFTDQDGDGVCDYRDSADRYESGTGQYATDGCPADFGHHSTRSGGHHREYCCR